MSCIYVDNRSQLIKFIQKKILFFFFVVATKLAYSSLELLILYLKNTLLNALIHFRNLQPEKTLVLGSSFIRATRRENQTFWSHPSFWNSDSKVSNILVPSVAGSGNLTWTEPCLTGALDGPLTKACCFT